MAAGQSDIREFDHPEHRQTRHADRDHPATPAGEESPYEDSGAQAEPLGAHLPRQYDQDVEDQDQPNRPEIALEAQQTADRNCAAGRNAEERDLGSWQIYRDMSERYDVHQTVDAVYPGDGPDRSRQVFRRSQPNPDPK